MKIYIERTNKKFEKRFSGNVASLLKALNINPETVLVVRNGNLLTKDSKLNNKDEIKILSVISGG